MIEFLAWKEKLEEITNTCYVKTQQTYCQPKLEITHFALIALVPVYQYHFSIITELKNGYFTYVAEVENIKRTLSLEYSANKGFIKRQQEN